MIDFPIADLFDDSLCLVWLERHLHPNGFVCPQCGSGNRRRFRTQGYYDAFRCRDCAGYYTFARPAPYHCSAALEAARMCCINVAFAAL